ncbi:MAG: hypothetical protein AABZ10_11910 [Nitrospirota bacterium]
MELLIEAKLMDERRLEDLMLEANEVLKIVVSSIRAARKNIRSGAKD